MQAQNILTTQIDTMNFMKSNDIRNVKNTFLCPIPLISENEQKWIFINILLFLKHFDSLGHIYFIFAYISTTFALAHAIRIKCQPNGISSSKKIRNGQSLHNYRICIWLLLLAMYPYIQIFYIFSEFLNPFFSLFSKLWMSVSWKPF